MKKYLKAFVLFAAIIMAAGEADAQYDPAKHFGVRASLDLSTSTTQTKVSKFGPGAGLGLWYYVPTSNLVYFDFGIGVSFDTFKLDGDISERFNNRYIKGHVEYPGLQLGINCGLKIMKAKYLMLSAYTGPQAYFTFLTQGKYDIIRPTYVEHVDKKLCDSGLNLGWTLGVALDLSCKLHFHVEGVFGLSNTFRSEEIIIGQASHFKRAQINIGIGYNFF